MPDEDAEIDRQLAFVRQALRDYAQIPGILAELRARPPSDSRPNGVTFAEIKGRTGLPLSTAHAWAHRDD